MEDKKHVSISDLSRMAGNIASGMVMRPDIWQPKTIPTQAVEMAAEIADLIEQHDANEDETNDSRLD